jgi:hypothetical protein
MSQPPLRWHLGIGARHCHTRTFSAGGGNKACYPWRNNYNILLNSKIYQTIKGAQ